MGGLPGRQQDITVARMVMRSLPEKMEVDVRSGPGGSFTYPAKLVRVTLRATALEKR